MTLLYTCYITNYEDQTVDDFILSLKSWITKSRRNTAIRYCTVMTVFYTLNYLQYRHIDQKIMPSLLVKDFRSVSLIKKSSWHVFLIERWYFCRNSIGFNQYGSTNRRNVWIVLSKPKISSCDVNHANFEWDDRPRALLSSDADKKPKTCKDISFA